MDRRGFDEPPKPFVLRSHAERGVSKDAPACTADAAPTGSSFETRRFASLL
jgi:hypothetical protein